MSILPLDRRTATHFLERSAHLALAIVMALFGAYASSGCAAQDAGLAEADATEGSVDETAALPADGPSRPVGTFRPARTDGVVLALLLKADNTFVRHVERACDEDACASGPAIERGTIRFTRRATHRYLELTAEGTGTAVRLEYWLNDSQTLILRRIGERGTVRYVRDAAQPLCAGSDDCSVQGLPPPTACSNASWQCVMGTCSAACDSPGDHGPVFLSDPPTCAQQGTLREGWYDGGVLVCAARCAGHTISCSHRSTPDEGWYTEPGAGCTDLLVRLEDCAVSPFE